MKIKSLFKNITIKQANVFTISIIFLLTMIFVGLLVEEIYRDYERALEKKSLIKDGIVFVEYTAKDGLKSILIKTVLVIITLSFIIFAIFLGINNIFNRLLNNDIQTFLDFFERAIYEDKFINPKSIFFKDFKKMVGYANEMVFKINKQKNSLKELNVNLEGRVSKKTTELLRINDNLKKEKKFSDDILKSQKEFLRYTVHETNTPLSVILTSIELYVKNNPKDRHLLKIEAAVKNIFNIYDDLSYLVKKEQVVYPKMVLNIEKYLSSRIDFFKDVAELSRIKFLYNAQVKDLYIYLNETKLQRIIDNTITNAIKYTLPGEEVLVKLEQVGSFIEFSMGSKSKLIKDTNKIFDAFYREEESQDGFGLGLRLVHNICNEEGIDVNVSSSDLMTTFSYKFIMIGK